MDEQAQPETSKASVDPIRVAEAKLAQVDSHLLDLENAGATDTVKFVQLLQEKMALCNFLKRLNEVNNCEVRIRYIEARIRGETPAHATMISIDRAKRRKARNNTNTLLLMFVALFVIAFATLPFIKNAFDTKMKVPSTAGLQRGEQDDTVAPIVPTTKQISDGAVVEINTESPGQRIDLNKILKDGETTAIYFHSEFCPPCKRMMPQFQRIGARTRNARFYTIDLDRPGSEHIDFDSPLAAQFDIHRLPYVIIFNGKEKSMEGYDAIDQLNAWSQQNI